MANSPQSKRLTGLNPLAYMGVDPITPPDLVIENHSPTTTDYENFNLGSFWLNSSNESLWLLVSKADGIATWIQLTSGGGGGPVLGLVGDNAVTAFPVAGLINVFGGANMHTAASGNTLDVILNDAIDLPSTNAAFTSGAILINSNRFMHAYGSQNTFLGTNTGNGTLTGNANTGIGYQALNASTTGFSNTAVGYNALTTLTTASNTVAIGTNALANLSTGGINEGNTAVGGQSLVLFTGTNTTAVGRGAGIDWVTGTENILIGDSCASKISSGDNNTFVGTVILGGSSGTATGPISNSIIIGKSAGSNFTSTESSNIIIGNSGVAADNNTIRIGTSGAGAGQQNTCYVAGIAGNTVSNLALVSIDTVTGQLGSTSPGSGSTMTTTFNSSGTWTPNPNTYWVVAYGWGGGGGGASGRQGASTAAGGGAGGPGCSAFYVSYPIIFFNPAGETVTIGAGGLGGAAQSSANTNGNDGSAAGVSYLGNISQLSLGGAGNPQGGIASGSAVSQGGRGPLFILDAGGNTSYNGGTGEQVNGGVVPPSYVSATSKGGGGGGGGDTATARSGSAGGDVLTPDGLSTLVAGGAGGVETGTINGAPGNNQLTSLTGGVVCGASGGGGGGGQKSGGSAGNGGQGGFPGGGGGGGGGSINGTNSGAGGNGGAGLVVVFEFMS